MPHDLASDPRAGVTPVTMLTDAVQRVPADRMAAIDETGRSITYGELLSAAHGLAARIGAERKLVLLEGGNHIPWLIAYIACLLGRHPALIAPAGNIEAMAQLEAAFRPQGRLASANGYEPESIPGDVKSVLHPDLAVLLSTSGSTGSAKCVRLSLANISANAESICAYLGIGGDERGMANLPTHYSYGLSIVNSHLMAGATLLLSSRSVTEDAYWDFCRRHGATSFAGVPHSYDLMRRIDLADRLPPTLRYFTQAGGRLPPDPVLYFAELAAARGIRFYVMYGQTEATARMAYMPPDQLAQNPDCIGVAIPNGRFSLIDDDGSPIGETGREGELVYEGPNVMMGYAVSPADLGAPSGPSRLPTGDIARRNQAGLFQITGRRSRFIKIFGNRLGLDDIERILGVAGHDAIATGIDDQLLVVTRHAGSTAAIKALLKEKLKLPPEYVTVREVDEFPLLASGKIDYAGLKASLVPPRAAADSASAESDPSERVRQAFNAVFGDAAKDEQASFRSLGGDSLNYIVTALSLEQVFRELPTDWDKTSIGALVQQARSQQQGMSVSASRLPLVLTKIDTVRGFACLLIVSFHFVGLTPDDGMKLPMDSWWHYFMDSFMMLRLPLFTALAGYLYGALPADRDGYPAFVLRKCQQLLVPMIFATIVYIVLRRINDGREEDILWAFLGGYRHLWYLETLVLLFMMIGLVDAIRRPGGVGLFGLMLLTAVISLAVPSDTVLHLKSTFFLFPFFLFGLLLYRMPALLRSRLLLGVALVAFAFSIAVQQLSMNGIGIVAEWHILRPASQPLAVILLAWICGCAAVISLLHFLPRIAALEVIAVYSFTIYLWHPLANNLIQKIFAKAGLQIDWLVFVLGVAAGVLIPILIHKVAQRVPKLSLPVIGR
jgi:acyl-CoA synthetase (AMP-forming)/AMP-acid ligase II/surface polysaccharide O-acyltransferase-like enzyme